MSLRGLRRYVGGRGNLIYGFVMNEIKIFKKRLLELLKEKALHIEKRTLTSGRVSDYYIDGKQVTLDPEGAFLIARLFLDMLKNTRVDAVGGLTLGADPIVASMAAISHVQGSPIKAFIVRKTPKKHGMQRYIEGPDLDSSSRVVIVDDVVTTGGSILKAIEVIEKQGCKVVKVLAIVDRLEGAKENLAEKDYRLVSLFNRDDLL